MPPDKPNDPAPTLTDTLQELEHLIPGQNGAAPVPVLDDLVEPGDLAEPDEPDTAAHNLDELEQRLQRRLDAELADLTGVLKDVIRRCVSEELSARSPEPGPGHSEAPSEPRDRD